MSTTLETMYTGALIVHAAATGMLAGVIWFVQIVHYPLLAAVGPERFAAYHHGHVRRTGAVVGPLMVVELLAALALAAMASGAGRGILIAGLVLLAVIWAATFLVQVPCHDALRRGYDPAVGRRLVRSNWTRTALWTMRFALALALFQFSA